MEKVIAKIKISLQKAAKPCPQKERGWVQKYLGTKRKFLCVKASERDKILRQTAGEIKEMSPKEIVELFDELFLSDTFEFVNFGGKLLVISTKARESIGFSDLEKWLEPTAGWAECDSICQSLFSEKEVLARWNEWQKNIAKFSRNKNIQLRRASLVLQCKPSRGSNDPQLRQLAFETIEKLKGEKEVLITKAVSWLLRSLAVKNGQEVLQYLQENKDSLPKNAYRETMKKITTGKK